MYKKLLLFLNFIPATFFAQAVSLDPTLVGGTSFNNASTEIIAMPDGKILVGGWFTGYNGTTVNRLAKLNSDGSLDLSFNTGTAVSNGGDVNEILVLPDGKIIVAGTFGYFNGLAKNYIVRLLPTGELDTSFENTIPNIYLNAVALQADGKLVAGGNTGKRIHRLNADGSADASFNVGNGFDNIVHSLAVQSDGKILAGGYFTNFDGTSAQSIIRLNSDGTRDASFNMGTGFFYNSTTTPLISNIIFLYNGKILVAGRFISYNGVLSKSLIRLEANGNVDASFNIGAGFATSATAVGSVAAVKIMADGKYLVGGTFNQCDNQNHKSIVKLNTDGSIDSSMNFGSGFDTTVRAIDIQADGKTLVLGDFIAYNGSNIRRLARLETNLLSSDEFVQLKKIIIYPNPSRESVSLHYEGGNIQGYSIIDFSGKVIQSGNESVTRINISSLASGNYILMLKTNDGNISDKLIVQ